MDESADQLLFTRSDLQDARSATLIDVPDIITQRLAPPYGQQDRTL
jgi:hypothetical protein